MLLRLKKNRQWQITETALLFLMHMENDKSAILKPIMLVATYITGIVIMVSGLGLVVIIERMCSSEACIRAGMDITEVSIAGMGIMLDAVGTGATTITEEAITGMGIMLDAVGTGATTITEEAITGMVAGIIHTAGEVFTEGDTEDIGSLIRCSCLHIHDILIDQAWKRRYHSFQSCDVAN